MKTRKKPLYDNVHKLDCSIAIFHIINLFFRNVSSTSNSFLPVYLFLCVMFGIGELFISSKISVQFTLSMTDKLFTVVNYFLYRRNNWICWQMLLIIINWGKLRASLSTSYFTILHQSIFIPVIKLNQLTLFIVIFFSLQFHHEKMIPSLHHKHSKSTSTLVLPCAGLQV